jgi:glycosyltransferase involved in cell wall biosynthesis
MKQRIVIISSQAHAIYNFRGLLIREMLDRGHSVYALAPDYDEELRDHVSQIGAVPVPYELSKNGMNPICDLISMVKLAKLLVNINPDVVLSFFIKPVIFGTAAASIAGIKRRFAMIEGLGFIFTDQKDSAMGVRKAILRSLVSTLYKNAFRKLTRAFFLNNDDIADFTRSGIIKETPITNIGGIGVDLNYWSPAPFESKEEVRFLMIARLLKDKGIYEFVDAARIVKKLYPNASFVVVGGFDTNPSSIKEEELNSWIDEGLIEYPGQVKDVRAWIARSHVFVLPSYREGMPRTSQEAMAMGRAVVSTDTAGCRDTVVEGRNGFLVPVKDSIALAAALKIFIEQPNLIESMGKESRRMAEVRFDAYIINQVILKEMQLD